jgi:hypothetical protein
VRTDSLLLFLGEGSASVDLLKATGLKDVVFRLNWWSVQWIITALRTISPEHRDLQQITIWLSYYLTYFGFGGNVRRAVGEVNYGQWLDLDCLLVGLWESYSIRPKAAVSTDQAEGIEGARDCVGHLLLEMTKRGLIDLVEYQHMSQEV